MKIKILHTADNHLDPKMRILRHKEMERRKDFIKSFKHVVDYALERKPHIFIIAGDLFDSVNPRNPARTIAIKLLKRLHSQNIKTFIISGNHDTPRSQEEGASPISEIQAAGIAKYFYTTSEMQAEHININGLDVCISGASYNPTWPEEIDPLERMKIPLEGDINIAILHYNIESFTIPALWRAPTIKETSVPRQLHYLALGHLHKQQHKRIGPTLVAYPGSTERRTFLEENHPQKGFIWTEIDQQGTTTTEFIQVPARPLKTVKIRLTEEDQNPVAKVVRTAQHAANKDLILRIKVTGQLPLETLTKYRREEVTTKLENLFFQVVIDDQDLEYKPEELPETPDVELSPIEAYKTYIQQLIKNVQNPEEKEVLERALKYGLQKLEEAGAW